MSAMKIFLSLCFLLILVGNNSYSGPVKEIWETTLPFKVISDQPSLSVPSDKVRIKGCGKYKDVTILNALIGTVGEKYTTKTDSTGYFEITIPSSEKAIYYYADGYKEFLFNHVTFKSGHELVVELYPQSIYDAIELDDDERRKSPVVAYKPVIYAYAKQPTELLINIEPKGEMTFTYPAYQEQWKCEAKEDGLLQVGDKTYPYLFWEAHLDELSYQYEDGQIIGFLVQTDTLVPFLENVLSSCGLNDREKADFITFWAPKMQKSPYVLTQFLVDDVYESEIATLTVSPKPDNIRRVFMVYTPFWSKPKLKLKTPSFSPIKREGITIIEWGGSQLKINEL
jgi:hypothetical protein